MKRQFLCAGALALLLAGCSTKQPPIVFLSAPKLPAYLTNPAAAAPGLSQTDAQAINVAAFTKLLDFHPWGGGAYAAIFLQADDRVVNALIEKFPRHNPPIKPAAQLDLRSAQQPMDRATGLPALILSTELSPPAADGSVQVKGNWYAGPAAKGATTFTLKKSGNDWVVAGEK